MLIKRTFIPGSEWLYIKIYTGVKTADVILEEAVNPLLQKLQEEDLIRKWFFIRYNDPKIHLRLRFELSDIHHFSKVLSLITDCLQEHIDSGEISEFLVDVYKREVERYGEQTIEAAEFLFWKSSNEILREYLHFDDEEKIMVALFHIDKMLDYLGLTIHEKVEWAGHGNQSFKKEFNADKRLNSQLDKKYRVFTSQYSEFVESDDYMPFKKIIQKNINECEEVLQYIKSNNPDAIQTFFPSVFHMHVNRLFISNQRLFEMIIYDYLSRYYKSLAFKN
ncbi:lantibiotic dehydratase [Chryseobacterium lactis]|uniref:Lantibiotic dehydratase n=1 Tax=Chryseobacterium lactis TaxID=1241981 RepID=A0A3G6RYY2_CHRLC|nr:thiopeptide-type bacteriocin biosynthesis protein [Chryseobacterium lactis]AZA82028.1 lantibiotic dehydratase [Chryseobacterium lactis]AZB07026.1 lantibiotic dehydratase [Chryseobacterium lactis]PNW11027.1 lantibiotic dehydratase [Chryseobacterium lactis]